MPRVAPLIEIGGEAAGRNQCGKIRGGERGAQGEFRGRRIPLGEFTFLKGGTPSVHGVHLGQPVIPVGQLQGDRDLAHVQVSIGAKRLARDARQQRAPLERRRCRRSAAPKRKGSVLLIVVERPREACSGRPVGDRLGIQSGAGLVGRIPGTPRAGYGQCADVACDLLALEFGEAVKTGPGDDGRVGEAEVLEIAAIVSMAVRTVGADQRRGLEAPRRERRVLPKLLSGQDRIGIAQGRRPRGGIFLDECIRFQRGARIGGKKIEGQDSKAADHSIGMVEAESKRVGAFAPRRARGSGRVICRVENPPPIPP